MASGMPQTTVELPVFPDHNLAKLAAVRHVAPLPFVPGAEDDVLACLLSKFDERRHTNLAAVFGARIAVDQPIVTA